MELKCRKLALKILFKIGFFNQIKRCRSCLISILSRLPVCHQQPSEIVFSDVLLKSDISVARISEDVIKYGSLFFV